jgi:hypothetical protein
MTVIDFAPGHHGHFLEYVVNNYIFNIDAPVKNLFQSSGAAHNINISTRYQERKIVTSGHYSSFDYVYPSDTRKVIWVKHAPELDFVLLVNVFHRCHPDAVTGKDVNIREIMQLHQDAMFESGQSLAKLRSNWYAKLQERHFAQYESKHQTDLATFDFDYSSFFYIDKFILELRTLADFLQSKFTYNQSFVTLYQEFISKNQGWHQYRHARALLDAVLTNRSESIDQSDWQTQSWTNHQLSQLFKIYDGELYSTDQYPSDTRYIHNLIAKFIVDYDANF